MSSTQKVKREESGIRATFGNVNRVTLIIWTAETLTVHEARSLDIACTVRILTEGVDFVCVCECVIENRRQREEGRSVPLCEEKRGYAIVCCCVSGQCAEVIHSSALTYSCRRSALCSKPHTPKGIDYVFQLTFRVGKTH